MKKLFLFSFFTILLCPLFAHSQAVARESDIQFWHETTVTIPIYKTKDSKGKETEKISVFFNGVLRFGGNISRLMDERAGFGIDFKVNKYLTLTPSYLYRTEQPAPGRHEQESRLRFAGTLEKKFAHFSIKDRNLVEYRLRRNVPNSTRYRNRFTFTVPILKEKKELFSIYASDEIYFDFRAKRWSRNEFSPGISKKFSKNLTMDFFYLLQTSIRSSTTPKRVSAFGINVKIKVD